MKTITLTLPRHRIALLAAVTALEETVLALESQTTDSAYQTLEALFGVIPKSAGKLAEALDNMPPDEIKTDDDAPHVDGTESGETGPAPASLFNGAPPPPPPGNFIHPEKTNAPTTNVELDADGLPWDARINPASKLKLVKEKTWKLIRKLDPAFVEQVRAELRQAMAVTQRPVSDGAPPPPPPPDNSPTPGALVDGAQFFLKMTGAGITPEAQQAAADAIGVANIGLVMVAPDLIPKFDAILFPV